MCDKKENWLIKNKSKQIKSNKKQKTYKNKEIYLYDLRYDIT